jgi:hypothetical protein
MCGLPAWASPGFLLMAPRVLPSPVLRRLLEEEWATKLPGLPTPTPPDREGKKE